MSWELAIAWQAEERLPLFLQIARAIADDVRRGRLKPGDELPGSRSLAGTLAVHRNTVLAAYHELEAEGWIATERARGTFVSRELPEQRPRRFGPPPATRIARAGFDLPPAPESWVPYLPPARGVLTLAGGLPDLRLAPARELARAYRRALAGKEARRLLDYGDPQGHPRLRATLAEMLGATRGLAVTPASLLVTRGSQMALYLTARALFSPNDRVAVEALGYRPAWEAFRQAGAKVCAVPVDAHGLDVDALGRLHAESPLRAVYLTPHHHFPTTVTLSAGRRLQLLALAKKERIIVIEDDYDHEYHYDGRPILPLASADEAGVVVYVGTLSKILAPGLRIGYLAAPPDVIERLVARRLYVDRQGDQTVESAVASLLEDGEVQRHARRVRRLYQRRRDVLVDALHERLGNQLSFTAPTGGIAVWARAEGIDVDAWADRGLARGVLFHPGRRFAFDGRSRPYVRLGFAACDERELPEAVRRMADAR